MDTEAHARRVESLFNLQPHTCGTVLIGVEQSAFTPTPIPSRLPAGPLRVLFFGQFIPLHGIETIIGAARLMANESVEWTIVGRGQESQKIDRLLQEVPLPKVCRVDWVEYEVLREWIARADLCLGIFGTSEKAASVIPNKVLQVLASNRPVITRDSPAIRELLSHRPPCVYLVDAGNPEALAGAVREHRDQRLPQSCHDLSLIDRFTIPAIGRQMVALLERTLGLH
jgi:glycosyltransferase involved in cell wall biosynthesis